MNSRLYISFLFFAFSGTVWGQCFTLNGKIINASNNEVLSAAFSVRSDGRKQAVGKSTDNGLFSIKIPCNSTALIIEKSGFRAINIPVSGNEGTYFFEISLYPVDKQAVNRPYFQSEQKDTVLDNSDSTKSEKKVTRFFKLIDVQSKAVISGEVCLYHTKKTDKDCFTSSQNPEDGKVIFDQKDIIGIVANANGYQPYNGNLIIDEIDNSSSVYEIALSKVISVLAFSIKPEKNQSKNQPEITDKKRRKIPVKMMDASHGFAAVSTGENYQVKLSQGIGKSPLEVNLAKIAGLNLITLVLQNDSIDKPAMVQTPSREDPNFGKTALNNLSFRTIYFDQSKYDLRPAVKQTLDSMARWLAVNPSSLARVTGFTDNIGNPKRNLLLSEYRAKVIASYLINHGVKETQIYWKGMGGENPVASNDSEETKILNRRVEIKIDREVTSQTRKD